MDFINDAISSMNAFLDVFKDAAALFLCPIDTRYKLIMHSQFLIFGKRCTLCPFFYLLNYINVYLVCSESQICYFFSHILIISDNASDFNTSFKLQNCRSKASFHLVEVYLCGPLIDEILQQWK